MVSFPLLCVESQTIYSVSGREKHLNLKRACVIGYFPSTWSLLYLSCHHNRMACHQKKENKIKPRQQAYSNQSQQPEVLSNNHTFKPSRKQCLDYFLLHNLQTEKPFCCIISPNNTSPDNITLCHRFLPSRSSVLMNNNYETFTTKPTTINDRI